MNQTFGVPQKPADPFTVAVLFISSGFLLLSGLLFTVFPTFTAKYFPQDQFCGNGGRCFDVTPESVQYQGFGLLVIFVLFILPIITGWWKNQYRR